ncbi:uncharacterized protein LOC139923634 [Centroberyx gerrardi]
MDEVTIELDEEVTKHDSSTEPLPEPLLIILSPPPTFLPVPGQPTMSWDRWHKSFEHYLEALGETELVDSTKCVLLQNCLGQEGQRVYTTLIQGETTYAAAISALAIHFSSGRNPRTGRKFQQRAQRLGETVEQFVCALEELVKPCNFGDLEEKLILDQLIEKTNCTQLRERLLVEKETLTLAEALVIGKQLESASLGIQNVSVDNVDSGDHPVRRVAKRGRPGRWERRKKLKPHVTITPSSSSGRKDNDYYYSNEKQYYSSSDEHYGDSGDETDPDYDEAEDYDGGSDAEKVVISKTKTKGQFCPICIDRSFRNANKLARHMRTHTKEKPFSCPVCAMTFSQSYHMTRHLRNQHSAGQHVCSKCGESLGSWAELKTHKKTHAPEVLSCPNCDKKFLKSSVLLNHIKSHSKDHCNQIETRRSPKCDGLKKQESHNKDNYYSYEKRCYGGDENETDNSNDNECNGGEQTDAEFGNDDAKDKGPEVGGDKMEDEDCDEAKYYDGGDDKEKVISKTKRKGHFCPICVDRCFRGANKLARHMRTHTKEKPFSCPVCATTFSQSYHMTRHLRNQHGLGKHICSKCGETFGSWVELKTHKKTHGPEVLSCPVCEKTFKEKSALVNHIKSHSKVQSNPLHLICTECGKIFGRMYHLKRHLATHGKSTKSLCYKCPDCQRSYSLLKDLNKHLEIHRKDKNGTCLKCDQTFSCPEELETHMEIHEKSYLCTVCGKKFKVEYALKKHEQGHKEEQFYCTLCDKHFSKLSHYKRHIMVHVRRESKCPHCDSVFLQLTALKYHLRTHIEERPYQCPCCIETFTRKEDLEQHCLKHRKFKKEKPYSCTRCDYAFSSLPELTEHMSSHKGEQPLNCPDCGKTFLNKNKLEKHLSIHTGERPHLCSVCGNGFPSAASLKLHVHIHTGDKPFKCSQCSKSFRSSSGLRLHSRHHMAVRPSYPCPDCGRTYGRMTELKMHQRYHTGDKPYSCTCCNKRFVSKDKLNVHMRIHTGERPYSCSHCGQTFTQTGDRNRHINKYHL